MPTAERSLSEGKLALNSQLLLVEISTVRYCAHGVHQQLTVAPQTRHSRLLSARLVYFTTSADALVPSVAFPAGSPSHVPRKHERTQRRQRGSSGGIDTYMVSLEVAVGCSERDDGKKEHKDVHYFSDTRHVPEFRK